jgi:hypothetical protein
MDTATEGTFPCPGGSGIPAASATTRDTDSVSTADRAAAEVVVEVTEAVAEVEDMVVVKHHNKMPELLATTSKEVIRLMLTASAVVSVFRTWRFVCLT